VVNKETAGRTGIAWRHLTIALRNKAREKWKDGANWLVVGELVAAARFLVASAAVAQTRP
jgi:hypothetical protein